MSLIKGDVMNVMFGFKKSAKFEKALDKTFQKFESMSGAEILALGEQHADGQIAGLFASEFHNNPVKVHELSFVFDSPDSDLKSFVASFETRSTVNFQSGWVSGDVCAHTESGYNLFDTGCAFMGAAVLSAPGLLCAAA